MKKTISTEGVILDDIGTVQTACISNQILHLSRSFTGAADHYGVVTTFVTCPDGIAEELHARLDATVRTFFAEQNLGIKGTGSIQ